MSPSGSSSSAARTRMPVRIAPGRRRRRSAASPCPRRRAAPTRTRMAAGAGASGAARTPRSTSSRRRASPTSTKSRERVAGRGVVLLRRDEHAAVRRADALDAALLQAGEEAADDLPVLRVYGYSRTCGAVRASVTNPHHLGRRLATVWLVSGGARRSVNGGSVRGRAAFRGRSGAVLLERRSPR